MAKNTTPKAEAGKAGPGFTHEGKKYGFTKKSINVAGTTYISLDELADGNVKEQWTAKVQSGKAIDMKAISAKDAAKLAALFTEGKADSFLTEIKEGEPK